MSKANVDVVKRLFAALDAQDWEAVQDVFDPDVAWSPTEGTYHGLEGVVTSLAEWLEPWQEHSIEAEEVSDAGDHVLAVIHLVGRGAGSGMQIDQRFFQIYTIRESRIIRMVEFVERAQALQAAGLLE